MNHFRGSYKRHFLIVQSIEKMFRDMGYGYEHKLKICKKKKCRFLEIYKYLYGSV